MPWLCITTTSMNPKDKKNRIAAFLQPRQPHHHNYRSIMASLCSPPASHQTDPRIPLQAVGATAVSAFRSNIELGGGIWTDGRWDGGRRDRCTNGQGRRQVDLGVEGSQRKHSPRLKLVSSSIDHALRVSSLDLLLFQLAPGTYSSCCCCCCCSDARNPSLALSVVTLAVVAATSFSSSFSAAVVSMASASPRASVPCCWPVLWEDGGEERRVGAGCAASVVAEGNISSELALEEGEEALPIRESPSGSWRSGGEGLG